MMYESSRMERKREANRDSLLAAAEELFIESGFERTSMDEVASRADLTKRTLYQYFPSKEELLFAVAARLLSRYPLVLDPAGNGGDSAYRRLSSFVFRFYGLISERPGEAAVMDAALGLRGSLRNQGGGPAAREKLAALDRELGKLYGSFIGAVAEGTEDGSMRRGLDPEGSAFAVFFLIKGFLGLVAEVEELAQPGGHSRDELARYSLGLVLEGMKST